MVNYHELSDKEVNTVVAEKLKMVIDGGYFNSSSIAGGLTGNGDIKPFDPCNNILDAWPIITGNKIDINWGDDVHPALKGAVIASREKLSATHDNPLRAAMIVFLQMQEDNHD